MAFWIMFIWVFVIWYFFQEGNSVKELSSDGVYDIKVQTFYCIILFSIPFLIISLRTNFGDTASYIGELKGLNVDGDNFLSHVNKRDHSKLFYGLEYLYKKYISKEAQSFFVVIALIQSLLLFKTLKKYSTNLGMSIFLFIASSMAAQWMCNGTRQFISVAILFACTDWIIKNKWYFYIPIAVLLMGLTPITSRLGLADVPWYLDGIHQSTLIAIPMFFCIQGKPYNKKVWAVVVALVVLILSGGLDSVLNASVENTTYANDMKDVEADTGTAIFRVLVSAVPALMAFVARKKISQDDTPPVITLSANASVISAVLYIASAFTSGIYVGRLPIYAEIYNLILIPWLIMHAYKAQREIITAIMIIAYTGYFYYQTLTWSGQYQSEILGLY